VEGKGEEWEEIEIPTEMKADAEDAHHQLVDVLSNYDDVIMEKYLESEEITAEDLHRALRAATLSSEVVPVLCGSAFKNKGVQPMLDAVVDYLPSRRLPPTQARPGQGRVLERTCDDDAPFSASPSSDDGPYVGKLTYLRVYSGRCARRTVTNTTKDRKERVGRRSRCTRTAVRTATPASPATSWPPLAQADHHR